MDIELILLFVLLTSIILIILIMLLFLDRIIGEELEAISDEYKE